MLHLPLLGFSTFSIVHQHPNTTQPNTYIIIKRTENFIISWRKYIRGVVVDIFDKKSVTDTANSDSLFESVTPVISYCDQTPNYGYLVGVGDIEINNHEILDKLFKEINI